MYKRIGVRAGLHVVQEIGRIYGSETRYHLDVDFAESRIELGHLSRNPLDGEVILQIDAYRRAQRNEITARQRGGDRWRLGSCKGSSQCPDGEKNVAVG